MDPVLNKFAAGFFLNLSDAPFYYVIGVYIFCQNSLASYWSGQQALASYSLEEFSISNASIFDHWSMLRCVGLSRHGQSSEHW
jgi:hypothetical protein